MKEGGEEGEAVHEDSQNHPYQLPTLTSDLQQQIEEDSALMTRKGVYPHEYMDSFERFQEPQLPPRDSFFSSLKEEGISKTDYTHGQTVLNHSDMTDLGDYQNFYLLTDVLLLAKVFENFRGMCLKHYGINSVIITISLVSTRKLLLK